MDGQTARPRFGHANAPHHKFLPVKGGELPSWYERLDAGRSKNARIDTRAFAMSWVYLALLTGVVHVYKIEGRAFEIVLWTLLASLPLYEYVPFRLKKPVLAAAAAISMAWIYGLTTALAVIGFATAMVSFARSNRLSWKTRALTIAMIAVGLAMGRSSGSLAFVPSTFWPVAGTMLMFRLALYMYELKHAKKPESWSDTASYFLILPNWCFLHFPVVDYRTLQRGFYARDIVETRRRGLNMIFVGVTHLLCYRLVYHELLITPQDVVGPATLASYLACNYLLYLRVSGQFHIACGMLHLFGAHMPETHNKYLLASSFTDYWRRINIYWKDFMVKTVFNPVFFRLRKRPQSVALAGATTAVFVATWALHAWQSFWLRGHWGLSVTDGLFWGILGAMVLVNVQLDARRKPTAAAISPRMAFVRRLAGICGMLLSITLLWSLWSASNLRDWLDMIGRGLLLS
jgi:D-alanyl-lipoteichoic acid acyltransferase DltB (MBOAT superfamily)